MRYYAVKAHAYQQEPKYPNPGCDEDNPQICFWEAQPGSSTVEISVTNCGSFYVYFLQPKIEVLKRDVYRPPLPSFLNPKPHIPSEPSYCTTTESINRGNIYRLFCSFLKIF